MFPSSFYVRYIRSPVKHVWYLLALHYNLKDRSGGLNQVWLTQHEFVPTEAAAGKSKQVLVAKLGGEDRFSFPVC